MSQSEDDDKQPTKLETSLRTHSKSRQPPHYLGGLTSIGKTTDGIMMLAALTYVFRKHCKTDATDLSK